MTNQPAERHAPTTDDLAALLKVARLKRGEWPFGPQILREGLDGVTEDHSPVVARAIVSGIESLADLGRAHDSFRSLAIKYGFQSLADAADVLACLSYVLRLGDKKALKLLVGSARRITGGVHGGRRHEQLRRLADALDDQLEHGEAKVVVFQRSVWWLPIYAPDLCPLKSRDAVDEMTDRWLYRTPASLLEAIGEKPRRLRSQTENWLERADGESLVKKSAEMYGVPASKARHLFDAEDARLARGAGKRK